MDVLEEDIMSSCKLDHSLSDVTNKLEEQKSFLPEELYIESSQLLKKELDQQTLNEVFHLLKKYDLATDEVKEERNEGLKQIISSL